MKITDDMRHEFLVLLAQFGNVTVCARQVGVSRAAVYKLRIRDKYFSDAMDLALYAYRKEIARIDRAVLDSSPE